MARRGIIFIVMLTLVAGCFGNEEDVSRNGDWSEITTAARGSLVRFYMQSGQGRLDSWIDTEVAEEVKRRFDVTLVRVPLDADVVVAKLVAEREKGMRVGDVDLFWLNGERFRKARQAGVLFGPFAEKLPNFIRYVDKEMASQDSGYAVDGYEVPLGRTHFMAIPESAPNKAGALVVSNYLLSPKARDFEF